MVTAEENRAEAEIMRAVISPESGKQQLMVWSHTEGIFNPQKPEQGKAFNWSN